MANIIVRESRLADAVNLACIAVVMSVDIAYFCKYALRSQLEFLLPVFPSLLILWFLLSHLCWRITFSETDDCFTEYRLFHKPLVVRKSDVVRYAVRNVAYRKTDMQVLVVETPSREIQIREHCRNYDAFERFLYSPAVCA